MKKLLFVLPALLMFAFCAKEESVTEAAQAPPTVAGERGGDCLLTIFTNSQLEVCGDIVQNNTPCQSCQIGGTNGQEFISTTTVYNVDVSQVRLYTIRNPNQQPANFFMTSSGGYANGFTLGGGECVNFAIGGDCLIIGAR